jgi:serine/threonine protein kinase
VKLNPEPNPTTLIGELVENRYRILDILGEGGSGATYRAKDEQTGQTVALKALSLRRMSDWKALELFEREAQVLAQLHHPAIPQYLAHFHTDTPHDRTFYLVQQLAAGQSLAQRVQAGWRSTEAEVRQIAEQILNTLIYLHSLTPPVIHRDLKPQNLIRQANGQIHLVDFGAVQHTYYNTLMRGSTVVGTFGYMAPEQFRGQAVAATDLYSLGATLLFLLTHRSPAELPTDRLKLDFRSHIQVSAAFADWLEQMLEPELTDRFTTAQEALDVLQGRQPLPPLLSESRPTETPIRLTKSDRSLRIDIPPIGLRTPQSRQFGLITLIWDGSLLLLIGAVLILSLFPRLSNLLWLGGFAVVGLWILTTFLYGTLSRVRLELDDRHFHLQKWLLGSRYCNVKGNLSQIRQVQSQTILKLASKDTSFTCCSLKLRWRTRSLGSCLTPVEAKWLVKEIQAFLG